MGTRFYHAIYKEPVLVWAVIIWQSGMAAAMNIPRFYNKNKQETPENPPTLKEVVAGMQKKIGHQESLSAAPSS